MLNYDLQLSILKTLSTTYVDDKRVEISSKDFSSKYDDFLLNITYLKREKLVDLSSVSTRNIHNADDSVSESYAVARATITHSGIKVLAGLSANKVVVNPYY